MEIYEAWNVYTPLFKCLRVSFFSSSSGKKTLDSMVWGCGYLGKSISGVCGLPWAEGFRDYLSVCHEGAMGKTLIKNSIIHLQSDRIAIIKYIHTIKQAFKKIKIIKDKVHWLKRTCIYTSSNLAVTEKLLDDMTSQLSMLFIIVPEKDQEQIGQLYYIPEYNNFCVWNVITVIERLLTLTLKVNIAHVENGSE